MFRLYVAWLRERGTRPPPCSESKRVEGGWRQVEMTSKMCEASEARACVYVEIYL